MHNTGYRIYNRKDPDGQYKLDLSHPPDYQTALELLRLAQLQGPKTWKKPTLNKKKFNVDGLEKITFPTSGLLTLEFVGLHKSSELDGMTEEEFELVWSRMIVRRVGPAEGAARHGALRASSAAARR